MNRYKINNVFSMAVMSAAIAAAALLGSCTEAPGTKSDEGAPKLKLTAIAPTTAAQVAQLDLSISKSEGGYDVSVKAGPDMQDSDQVFFNISYDPQAFHSHGLGTAQGDPISSANDSSTIGMSIEAEPGVIDAGVTVAGPADGHAIQPGDTLTSFQLLNGGNPKATSSAPDSSRSGARNLALAQDGDGHWVLSWDYTNPGDTNQDGEVGINDLTPIGMHYLERVADSYEDPIRHIDGDHNGEINLADLTPVGQNYSSELWAYQIEMSEDGVENFITVGQLLLGDQNATPGETVRFSYTFGAQYVTGAWYRVVPVDHDLEFGTPSESINESSRMLAGISSSTGQQHTVVVNVHDLEVPIAQMNSVRIVYPASFKYVKNSYNCGSPGGTRDTIDGIWASFANGILFPPESFIIEQILPDGRKALDLNVTVTDKALPAAPTGYGDLFNLVLESTGSEDLTLQFQVQSTDGLTRTLYSDSEEGMHEFGSSLSIEAF